MEDLINSLGPEFAATGILIYFIRNTLQSMERRLDNCLKQNREQTEGFMEFIEEQRKELIEYITVMSKEENGKKVVLITPKNSNSGEQNISKIE